MRKDSTLAILSVLFILILTFAATTSLAAPGDIDYNKNQFQLGESVYFNHGDGIYCFKRVEDKNNYVFPHHWRFKRFLKGMFVKIETYTFRVFCLSTNRMEDIEEKVAVIKTKIRGETFIIRQPIIRTIPQQRLLLLNW
jgi:hypothetical protein